MKEQGWTCESIKRAATNRNEWRVLVDALCAVEETDLVDLVEDAT